MEVTLILRRFRPSIMWRTDNAESSSTQMRDREFSYDIYVKLKLLFLMKTFRLMCNVKYYCFFAADYNSEIHDRISNMFKVPQNRSVKSGTCMCVYKQIQN